MSDDNFALGFAQLFLLLGFAFIFPWIELAVVNAILKKTANRALLLGIPAVILLLGYFLVMDGAGLIILTSLVLIGPMAAIIPPYAIPGLTNPEGRFARILICFVAVTLFGFALIAGFTFVVPETSEYFPSNLLVNAVLYAGIIVLDTAFAYLIYVIMRKLRPLEMAMDATPG